MAWHLNHGGTKRVVLLWAIYDTSEGKLVSDFKKKKLLRTLARPIWDGNICSGWAPKGSTVWKQICWSAPGGGCWWAGRGLLILWEACGERQQGQRTWGLNKPNQDGKEGYIRKTKSRSFMTNNTELLQFLPLGRIHKDPSANPFLWALFNRFLY